MPHTTGLVPTLFFRTFDDECLLRVNIIRYLINDLKSAGRIIFYPYITIHKATPGSGPIATVSVDKVTKRELEKWSQGTGTEHPAAAIIGHGLYFGLVLHGFVLGIYERYVDALPAKFVPRVHHVAKAHGMPCHPAL